MSDATITLGNNLQPPAVNGEKCQEIYDLIRSEEFEPAEFNAMLMAVVVYIETHTGSTFNDDCLPWAEECTEQ